MANNSDIFKTVGALSASATAKYVGSIIAATGITAAAEIIAITGLPKSTVYRALAEFFAAGGGSLIRPTGEIPTSLTSPTSENLTCPTDGNCSEKPVSLVPLVGMGLAHASIDSRATKELPSEVTLYEDIISPLAPQPSKTKPARRGSRLPDDWSLPADWRDWTAVNCPSSSPAAIERESLMFANFWQAKPGSQACKLDWKKTWQNWCLKAFATAPVRPGSTGVFQSADERKRQRERESRALLDSLCAGAVQ